MPHVPGTEVLASMRAIVDYNWQDEARDYEECASNENSQEGHVFEHLKRVDGWLETQTNQTGDGSDTATVDLIDPRGVVGETFNGSVDEVANQARDFITAQLIDGLSGSVDFDLQ